MKLWNWAGFALKDSLEYYRLVIQIPNMSVFVGWSVKIRFIGVFLPLIA